MKNQISSCHHYSESLSQRRSLRSVVGSQPQEGYILYAILTGQLVMIIFRETSKIPGVTKTKDQYVPVRIPFMMDI
jgi:hypothetical protein